MHNRFSLSFNLLWVLWGFVTLLGFTIGFLTGFASLSGLLIGIGQWTVLRTKLPSTWLWILATAVGFPVGILLGTIDLIALGWTIQFPYVWTTHLFIASVTGAVIGLLQWLALYKKFDGAGRWVFVSAVSWGVGLTTALSVFGTNQSNFGFGILLGMLVGAISGAFVESVLGQPGLTHESI